MKVDIQVESLENQKKYNKRLANARILQYNFDKDKIF